MHTSFISRMKTVPPQVKLHPRSVCTGPQWALMQYKQWLLWWKEGRQKGRRKKERKEWRNQGRDKEREAEVEGGQRLKPKLAAGIQHEGFEKPPTDLWGNPSSLLPFSALLNYLLSPPFLTLQTRCLTQAVIRQRIAELKKKSHFTGVSSLQTRSPRS